MVDDRAALEQEDPVAGPLDVAHQVRREQQADAELAARLADQREHLLAAGRVEPRRRLVEEDEHRVVDERLRELHALPHPGRVAADRPVALLEQADVAQRVRGAGAGLAARQAAHLRHVAEELRRRDVPRQAVVLGHVAEPGPDRDVARRVLPERLGDALRRLEQAEEDADQGALAGAVRAEQPRDRPADLDVDPVEREHLPEPLRQPAGLEKHLHAADRRQAAARPVSGFPRARYGPVTPRRYATMRSTAGANEASGAPAR